MRALFVESLSLRGFRNISAADIEFGPAFNVISGENGQGKTNVLEGVYALATSRSFRVHRPGELVQFGQETASLRARIVEGGEVREQSVGFREGMRLVKVDGKKPATLASYAVKTPSVIFHPGEVELASGGGSERRRLLDRIALYVAPVASSELERYSRALRERQRALDVRGPGARDAPEWEELMVRHGAPVFAARAEAARRLAESASRAFQRIAAEGLELVVEYIPGGPMDPVVFRDKLARSRASDASRRAASSGPHRDDLALRMNGHGVRGFASQGQLRAVVLALKSAEVEVLSTATGVRPILLLDDVSSELDRERTAALFLHLRTHDGQVFLTTTRPELIELSGARAGSRNDFVVRGGVLHG